jgi:hypothetical protein
LKIIQQFHRLSEKSRFLRASFPPRPRKKFGANAGSAFQPEETADDCETPFIPRTPREWPVAGNRH